MKLAELLEHRKNTRAGVTAVLAALGAEEEAAFAIEEPFVLYVATSLGLGRWTVQEDGRSESCKGSIRPWAVALQGLRVDTSTHVDPWGVHFAIGLSVPDDLDLKSETDSMDREALADFAGACLRHADSG
jgi:hypothetical protein